MVLSESPRSECLFPSPGSLKSFLPLSVFLLLLGSPHVYTVPFDSVL